MSPFALRAALSWLPGSTTPLGGTSDASTPRCTVLLTALATLGLQSPAHGEHRGTPDGEPSPERRHPVRLQRRGAASAAAGRSSAPRWCSPPATAPTAWTARCWSRFESVIAETADDFDVPQRGRTRTQGYTEAEAHRGRLRRPAPRYTHPEYSDFTDLEQLERRRRGRARPSRSPASRPATHRRRRHARRDRQVRSCPRPCSPPSGTAPRCASPSPARRRPYADELPAAPPLRRHARVRS